MSFGDPVTVAPGAEVTVKNDDTAEHSVTSQTEGVFDEHVDGGEQDTFTAPTEPGEYAFLLRAPPVDEGHADRQVAAWQTAPTRPPPRFRRHSKRASAELAGSSIVVARAQIEGADMDRNAMVWIIVAVAAIIVIALVAFVTQVAPPRRSRTTPRRDRAADRASREARSHCHRNRGEGTGRAGGSRGEGCRGARLQNTAQTHREAVTTSRDELDAHRERVDQLDPKGRTDEPAPGTADEVRSDAPAADPRHANDHRRP